MALWSCHSKQRKVAMYHLHHHNCIVVQISLAVTFVSLARLMGHTNHGHVHGFHFHTSLSGSTIWHSISDTDTRIRPLSPLSSASRGFEGSAAGSSSAKMPPSKSSSFSSQQQQQQQSNIKKPSPQTSPPPSYRDRSIDASQRLGVRLSRIDFPPWFWRLSWKVHSRALPILHWWDEARTPGLDNCLKCLWCKAISAADKSSPAYEHRQQWTYDMLPSITRWIVLKNPILPLWTFPRLVHYVIELRTTFLNGALRNEIRHRYRQQQQQLQQQKTKQKIRLISLGAGYDTRSIQFLNVEDRGNEDSCSCKDDVTTGNIEVLRVDEAYELDMPDVVSSKTIMLTRLVQRRQQRRAARLRNHTVEDQEPSTKLPTLMSQDLTDINGLKSCLDKIFSNNDDGGDGPATLYTIFLVEGVLIYLSEAQRSAVLSTCSQYLKDRGLHGSLLFADRIRKPSDPTLDEMKTWLDGDGWTLNNGSFAVHPGKARHMGIARV